MSTPPLDRLPTKRSLRVHVKMYQEEFFRKALSISVNQRDSGLMVTPHLEDWGKISCSQLTVSSTGGLVPDENGYVTTGPENKPKLHYHRSGMSSVQPAGFSGANGRRTIHLPAMATLDAVQIFSVAARVPGRLPHASRVGVGDIVTIMDRPDVTSLFMSGIIYDRRQIAVGSIGGLREGNPVTLASSHGNMFLVDLSGYGLEAVLGIIFGPTQRRLPDWAADFSLVSFHQERMHTEGAVAIHAGHGIPMAAITGGIPSVEEIHRVAAIDVKSSTIPNIYPESHNISTDQRNRGQRQESNGRPFLAGSPSSEFTQRPLGIFLRNFKNKNSSPTDPEARKA